MELKEILALMKRKHSKSNDQVPTLIIYGDGSGMIVQTGHDNIRTPIYDMPRDEDFNTLEELIQRLQEK